MVQQVLIKRTSTNDSPPANGSLQPGELAIEMGTPTRLWVGVPVGIDPSGKKQLTPSGGVYVAEDPPALTKQGDLWYESDVGILWMWYEDPTLPGQWVQVNGTSGGNFTQADADALYVKLTGDTMTGTLKIQSGGALEVTSANHGVAVSADASSSAVMGTLNGLLQWVMALGDSATDFSIMRYDDTGALIPGSVLTINRATGQTTLSGNLAIVHASGDALYTTNGINLSKAASGSVVGITGFTANSPRWALTLGDSVPETGADVGSDFRIDRYNDAGALVGQALAIDRATGFTRFFGNVEIYGTSTLVVGGKVLASGIATRPGSVGAPHPNDIHNIWWDGSAHLWINTTDVGVFIPTSDYRIKKDVAPLTTMWDVVKSLNPIKYTQAEWTPPQPPPDEQGNARPAPAPMFIADNIERWGFIAHELQEAMVPFAASAEKDAPNAIQSPNPFTVIAALTKALQEAMTRIEALEAIAPTGTPTRSK